MSTVKIGVVGLGSMGSAHVTGLVQMPGVELAFVCDSDAAVLEAVSSSLSVAAAATDYREFVSSDVDAVVVATPEALHAAPVIDFLEAGKDVLVEKPLATNLDDARAMVTAAARTTRLLAVGMNLRYEPRFRLVRDWISESRDGGIISMSFRRNRPAPLFDRYSRVHPAFETGSHDVDLALWYANDRIARVFAVERQRPGDPNPFGTWAVAEFERGAVACFETVWLIPHEANVERDDVVEVIGRDGTARVSIAEPGIVFFDRAGQYSRDPIYDPSSLNTVSIALMFELREFVAAVKRERESCAFSLKDALHGIEVIDAMIESARCGEPVTVGGLSMTDEKTHAIAATPTS